MAEKENVPWLLSCPHEACNLRCGEGRKGGEEVDVVLKYESTPRATRQRDTRCLLVRVKAAALAVLAVSVLGFVLWLIAFAPAVSVAAPVGILAIVVFAATARATQQRPASSVQWEASAPPAATRSTARRTSAEMLEVA